MNGVLAQYETLKKYGSGILNSHKSSRLNCGLNLMDVGFLGVVGKSGWDFEDDFSSYADQAAADSAWPTTSTALLRVNITNDNLDWDGGASHRINHDMGAGSVSDTACVFRSTLDVVNMTAGDARFVAVLLSADNNPGNTASEYMGLIMSTDPGTLSFAAHAEENAVLLQQAGTTLETGVKYLEIKRLTATTFRAQLWLNADFTNSFFVQTPTIVSTIGSFRHIKISLRHGTGGDIDGTLDKVQFADGVTVAP